MNNIVDKIKKDYRKGDLVMSELLRSYSLVSPSEKYSLLKWSGEDDLMGVTPSGRIVSIKELIHYLKQNIPYQIMNQKDSNGKYIFDRIKMRFETDGVSDGVTTFLMNDARHSNDRFAYNMVYINKMACGHYELFQTPCNDYYSLEENLLNGYLHSLESECSSCICSLGEPEEVKMMKKLPFNRRFKNYEDAKSFVQSHLCEGWVFEQKRTYGLGLLTELYVDFFNEVTVLYIPR